MICSTLSSELRRLRPSPWQGGGGYGGAGGGWCRLPGTSHATTAVPTVTVSVGNYVFINYDYTIICYPNIIIINKY